MRSMPRCRSRHDVRPLTPPHAAIELSGVTLGYPGHVVLRDASFAIKPGEFIGLLGPNGAGKTTLMRALLGLVRPLHGAISIFGTPARPGNPGMGYMPQSRMAHGGSRILGRAFVASAAYGPRWGQRWGLPVLDAVARRDVAWALDMVDATALAARPLRDLSGGERQRLLIAQALLSQPKILLLDEPLISLDLHHQHAIVALARHLQATLDMTVLFSAHELNPLIGAMDRVLYIGGGHVAIGAVDDVVTGPVLSRLYGTTIEIVRASGRIFVVNDGPGEHSPADRAPH